MYLSLLISPGLFFLTQFGCPGGLIYDQLIWINPEWEETPIPAIHALNVNFIHRTPFFFGQKIVL